MLFRIFADKSLSYKEMKDRKVVVYHLHLFGEDIAVRDHYFGSIAALCSSFDKSKIGIVASSLYNLNLDEEGNPVFENKHCRIRKAILKTKPKRNVKKM